MNIHDGAKVRYSPPLVPKSKITISAASTTVHRWTQRLRHGKSVWFLSWIKPHFRREIQVIKSYNTSIDIRQSTLLQSFYARAIGSPDNWDDERFKVPCGNLVLIHWIHQECIFLRSFPWQIPSCETDSPHRRHSARPSLNNPVVHGYQFHIPFSPMFNVILWAILLTDICGDFYHKVRFVDNQPITARSVDL